MDTNINLFPNPPKHYKLFEREDSLIPPDLNALNKLNSFMSFGVEYKMKEVNFSTTPVESNFLRAYDPKLIDSKNIPNRNLFEGENVTNQTLSQLNIDNLNVSVFDMIESEVKFVKKTYEEMLDQISNIQDFELNSCLIKYSYQKIYFLISLLKKKKVGNC
jgi:hypothetical protein